MSNTRTVVNSHISKIAAKHRSGVLLSRDDAHYLIAAIGDLATETAQAEKEMETLRDDLQVAREAAKSASDTLDQLKAGIQDLRADASRVAGEVSAPDMERLWTGKAIAYETILGSIACLPRAVTPPLGEVRDPNPSVSRGLCAGRPMFRISAPDDCVVEIRWLSQKNGAGKFWQIHNREALGSADLGKDGTDALDAYAALVWRNRADTDVRLRDLTRRLSAALTEWSENPFP